jgi:type I restriction enzyme S subunit
MNDSLRPYPEYKASALKWLGKIPMHWTEKRGKYFLREVDERSLTGEEPLMSVSHKTGVTLRKSNVTMFKAESNVGHKICRTGDLAINTLWAWMAALGISRLTGLVSPAYGVYRQVDPKNYNADFLDYLLRTPPYATEYLCRSTGITSSRLRLYPIDFLRIPLIQPPREEQELIVRYLRNFDSLVQKFIRNRRRLIDVLNEQKQRLTQSAITSPNTQLYRMRDLVVEPNRQVTRVASQEYTPIGLYNWGRGIFHKSPIRGQDLGDSVFYWIEEGDLVFSGQFAWEGAVSLARRKDHRCIASHRYPVFICNSSLVLTSYLESYFQSSAGQLLMDVNSRGAAGRNRPLNVRSLLREPIPVPSIEEQLAIEDFANQVQRISDVVGRQIAFLREFRSRLITDVVTGKLDVQYLAAHTHSVELDEVNEIDAEEALDDELDGVEDDDLAEEALNADD